MLNRNARYSVVKVAMVCGPMTRRGNVSPTFTSSKCGETPSRFDSSQSRRSLSTLFQLGLRPALDVAELALEHAALLGFFVQVADRGRPLARHEDAVLVGVDGVPARKHRGPGEFGLHHLVVVEPSLLEQLVPRPHRAAVEPPFLAAEDQVAVRNVPHAGGSLRRARNPVPTAMDCGAIRPPNLESRANSLVPVERIGVVHRHHPAANVGRAARIPQLPAADGLAHPMIDVG